MCVKASVVKELERLNLIISSINHVRAVREAFEDCIGYASQRVPILDMPILDMQLFERQRNEL